MSFLTDFADQAVVLPVSALVGLMLLASGWPRGAAVWLAGIAGTLGAMLALKLLFQACGDTVPTLGIDSPSGHTAAAAVLYGGLAALFGAPPRIALASAAALAVLFGWSRMALGLHSLPEIVLGGVVGVAGAAALIRSLGARRARMSRAGLCAALLVGLVLFHGAHVRAEAAIGRASRYLAVWPLSTCRQPALAHGGTNGQDAAADARGSIR